MSTTSNPDPPEARSDAHAANPGVTADNPWELLVGLHPETTTYPARTRIGGEGIVIFKTKAGFRGVQRSCPHMQATMQQAVLAAGETMIRCFLHAYTFRLSDGRGVNCPGYKVRVYEVKEENGTLYGRAAN